MSTFRPRDLPALRDELKGMWQSPVGTAIWQAEGHRNAGLNDSPQPLSTRIEGQLALLKRAELYWVSEDVTALLQSAARTLPPTKIMAEDFPADFGMVVFARQIHALDTDRPDSDRLRVRAMLWAVAEHHESGKPLIHMEFYDDTTTARERFAAYPTEVLNSLGNLLYLGASSWYLGTPADDFSIYPHYDEHQKASLLEDRRLLHAFCLIVAQKHAEIREYVPAKKKQRQAQRRGYAASPVRVVDIRQRVAAERSEAGRRDVEWSHRWTVSAHWRNQWYPSQERHYPVLILPYVKGPEGKPLKAREIVRAVR